MSDVEFRISEITSTEDIRMMEKAKVVGDILNNHYPDYPWLVSWQGGVLVVKNALLGNQVGCPYGFIMKDDPDYGVLAHNAMIAGGELLERARLRRGKWDGEMPTQLDGADPRIWKSLH